MNCVTYRETLNSGVTNSESLAHLRSCPSCLEVAVASDPDNLFRSLGGVEAIPPGGIDAFVGDVMNQIHLRETEQSLDQRSRLAPWHRWSIAAALALAVTAITLNPGRQQPTVIAQQTPAVTVEPTSLPVVESYEEANATIVELPAAETADLKVVMIFDETLPVDL